MRRLLAVIVGMMFVMGTAYAQEQRRSGSGRSRGVPGRRHLLRTRAPTRRARISGTTHSARP